MWSYKFIRLGIHVCDNSVRLALIQKEKTNKILALTDSRAVNTKQINELIKPYKKHIKATAGISQNYFKHTITLPKKLTKSNINKYILHHGQNIFNTSIDNLNYSFSYHYTDKNTVVTLFAINKKKSNQLQGKLQSKHITTRSLEPIEYSLHRAFSLTNNIKSGCISLITDSTRTMVTASSSKQYLHSCTHNAQTSHSTTITNNHPALPANITLTATQNTLNRTDCAENITSDDNNVVFASLSSLNLNLSPKIIDSLVYLPAICLALGD